MRREPPDSSVHLCSVIKDKAVFDNWVFDAVAMKLWTSPVKRKRAKRHYLDEARFS
jgi:hypothetical protein